MNVRSVFVAITACALSLPVHSVDAQGAPAEEQAAPEPPTEAPPAPAQGPAGQQDSAAAAAGDGAKSPRAAEQGAAPGGGGVADAQDASNAQADEGDEGEAQEEAQEAEDYEDEEDEDYEDYDSDDDGESSADAPSRERDRLLFILRAGANVLGWGTTSLSDSCTGAACPVGVGDADDDFETDEVLPVLGLEAAAGLTDTVYLGLSALLHPSLATQLKDPPADNGGEVTLGNLFNFNLLGELRLAAGPLLIPLRVQGGVSVLAPDGETRAALDGTKKSCDAVNEMDGGSCSFSDWAWGAGGGGGVGVVFPAGEISVRFDVTYDFQWLRIGDLDQRAPDAVRSTQTTVTLSRLLVSAAVEL